MAVLFNKDKTEMIVSCKCGCEESVHIRIDAEYPDYYAIWTYMNGSFYTDWKGRVFKTICRKLKKIWAIIRNKDYYYSDIIMSKVEFEEFREFINSVKC
jgi:hypothetical protein